jgi:hypothetical protein
MYAYMLSDYEEHGSTNVTATLDRSLLLSMLDTNWANRSEAYRLQAREGLTKLLARSDEDLCGADGNACEHGWGGIQLHVIRLVEKS